MRNNGQGGVLKASSEAVIKEEKREEERSGGEGQCKTRQRHKDICVERCIKTSLASSDDGESGRNEVVKKKQQQSEQKKPKMVGPKDEGKLVFLC